VQVLINDYPVNFDLEQKGKITDVVDSISEWSRERDLIFYELYIDEALYAIDKLPLIDIDRVKVINCIVQSKADIVFSSIDEAVRYCDRVLAFIKHILDSGECHRDNIDNMLSGISWLLEVLLRTMGLLAIGGDSLKFKDRDLSYHIRYAEEFRDSLRELNDSRVVLDFLASRKDVFLEIKHIFKMLLLSDAMRSLIVQSIDSPDVLITSLAGAKEELSRQLLNVQAAAIAYQTGKDAEGSERLKEFVDFMYRYSRTCYQVVPVFRIELSDVEVGGLTLEDKNRELRNLLHEVIGVMENNDIISLSDLLEYEITPAIANLDKYINALLSEISSK
jgi:hypothetical protein